MNHEKSKIIVIMGPTASGKSDAAIKLAQKFNGEIISADSRQIYRGMDIGTGKVPQDFIRIFNFQFSIFKQKEGFFSESIRHYLIDIVDPNDEFNVSHFKKAAEIAIEEILAKGKLPIICGGTGFWIDAVVKNVNLPEVKPNEELRLELNTKSTEELFAILEKLDSNRAATIDRQNKYRLVRAIEICKAIGKVPKIMNHESGIMNYNFLQIGINVKREELNKKIKKRLDDRFEDGMIEEVENLHENGVSFEWMEKIGLEYRWISRFLQNKISLQEMKEKLYFDIIHYAKRQMTWFKRNKKILWLKDYNEIENEVEKFLA